MRRVSLPIRVGARPEQPAQASWGQRESERSEGVSWGWSEEGIRARGTGGIHGPARSAAKWVKWGEEGDSSDRRRYTSWKLIQEVSILRRKGGKLLIIREGS